MSGNWRAEEGDSSMGRALGGTPNADMSASDYPNSKRIDRCKCDGSFPRQIETTAAASPEKLKNFSDEAQIIIRAQAAFGGLC